MNPLKSGLHYNAKGLIDSLIINSVKPCYDHWMLANCFSPELKGETELSLVANQKEETQNKFTLYNSSQGEGSDFLH